MLKVTPVSPTKPLQKDIRDLIDASLAKALEEIGEEEFFYIGRHFERKASAVGASRISWVRDLAEQMRTLHHIYEAHTTGELDLPEQAVSLIGATLFYFVNPYDLVPDHLPGRGYLDDAYVLNSCVSRLSKLAPDCVE